MRILSDTSRACTTLQKLVCFVASLRTREQVTCLNHRRVTCQRVTYTRSLPAPELVVVDVPKLLFAVVCLQSVSQKIKEAQSGLQRLFYRRHVVVDTVLTQRRPVFKEEAQNLQEIQWTLLGGVYKLFTQGRTKTVRDTTYEMKINYFKDCCYYI